MLFENSKISKEESQLLLFAFLFRHDLSQSALEDLIQLVNLHMPKNASIPSSKFLLKKSLNANYNIIQRHYYCNTCNKYLGSENVGNCSNCKVKNNVQTLEKQGNFFIMFNLRSIL